MPTTETRLTWIQHAPKPGGLYFAECGPYSFEHAEAKARAERLADQHVPVIIEG